MIIHGQPDRQHKPESYTQRLIACGLLILLMLAGLVLCLNTATKVRREEQQYQAAPLCTNIGPSPLANASATCRLDTPMTVTDKWNEVISHGGGNVEKKTIDWTVELRTADGFPYRAVFETGGHTPNGYPRASIGATMETERWKNQVVWISIGGSTYHTDYYRGDLPGRIRNSTGFYLMASFFFVLLMLPIIGLVFILKKMADAG